MKKIVVSKFGGTSMADAQAMLRSAKVVVERNSSVVLVSATSGTTDKLLKLIADAESGDWEATFANWTELKNKHLEIARNLNAPDSLTLVLNKYFYELETLAKGISMLKECSLKTKDHVLSFGERLSSQLFYQALKNTWKDKNILCLDVRDIMATDSNFGKATPLIDQIETNAKNILVFNDNNVYVTQGFIGRDADGATTVLGRGGSDYSASLIGEAINADLVEIWTDVAGIATTDPRICSKAKMIHEITFDEASEMAHYGAKVLHPTTIVPAMRKNIPVFVGSSFDLNQAGTWIKKDVDFKPTVRALAKRSKQALLTIKTAKMLDAYGFMSKIFDVFGKHRISVDCITTSEISVAVTVDFATLDNKNFLQELKAIGEVSFEKDYALISLIGNGLLEKSGIAKTVFNAIDDTNIRMMCFGASSFNFNILVSESDADKCIQKLHFHFIENL